MASPIRVLVGTFNGGAGVNQSGFATFSFSITGGFEARVPIIVTCPGTTSISAGAEVTLYRSADNGATWETQGTPAIYFNKPTVASQVQRQTFDVTSGMYLVGVMVGGGCASTWSAQQGTADVMTAIA